MQTRFTLLQNAVWLFVVPDETSLLESHMLGMNRIFVLLCNSLFLMPYVLIPPKARKKINKNDLKILLWKKQLVNSTPYLKDAEPEL